MKGNFAQAHTRYEHAGEPAFRDHHRDRHDVECVTAENLAARASFAGQGRAHRSGRLGDKIGQRERRIAAGAAHRFAVSGGQESTLGRHERQKFGVVGKLIQQVAQERLHCIGVVEAEDPLKA